MTFARAVCVSLILSSSLCFSAEVLMVGKDNKYLAVSKKDEGDWRAGEPACVMKDEKEIACGRITKVRGRGAVLELVQKVETPKKGDFVRAGAPMELGVATPSPSADDKDLAELGAPEAPPTPKAAPRAAMKAQVPPAAAAPIARSGKRKPPAPIPPQAPPDEDSPAMMEHPITADMYDDPGFDALLGVIASPSYVIPHAAFQARILPQLAVGVRAGYFGASTPSNSAHAIPLLLTVDYYGKGYFSGLWVELAGGAYLFSITSTTGAPSESPISAAGYLTVGWRFHFWSGWNAGIGGGGQYLPTPPSSLITLAYGSFQPMVVVDGGFRF